MQLFLTKDIQNYPKMFLMIIMSARVNQYVIYELEII